MNPCAIGTKMHVGADPPTATVKVRSQLSGMARRKFWFVAMDAIARNVLRCVLRSAFALFPEGAPMWRAPMPNSVLVHLVQELWRNSVSPLVRAHGITVN